MTKSDLITLLSVVVTIAIGFATPDVRVFFGVEDMTGMKLLVGFAYASICALLWVYVINPMIPTRDHQFLTTTLEQQDQLIFSNMSVDISPENIVTLRTVINTFTGGILQPVKSLKPSNFTVQEHLDKQSKVIPLVNVTPMKSASQITILIDASESMWGETELIRNGVKLRKIQVVKESILNFSKKLIRSQGKSTSHDSSLSFMIFSGKGVYFLQDDNGGIWFKTEKRSLPVIEKVIGSINPSGQTPMFDAISYSIDVLNSEIRSSHKLILCLTDGVDNSSTIEPELLQTKIQNGGIPIVTVGYGIEGELDVPTLDAIAALSGAGAPGVGSFTNIKAKQLPSVFDRALNNINNTYEISWKSSFPISGKHVMARLQAAYKTVLGKKVSPVTEITYTVPSLKK